MHHIHPVADRSPEVTAGATDAGYPPKMGETALRAVKADMQCRVWLRMNSLNNTLTLYDIILITVVDLHLQLLIDHPITEYRHHTVASATANILTQQTGLATIHAFWLPLAAEQHRSQQYLCIAVTAQLLPRGPRGTWVTP